MHFVGSLRPPRLRRPSRPQDARPGLKAAIRTSPVPPIPIARALRTGARQSATEWSTSSEACVPTRARAEAIARPSMDAPASAHRPTGAAPRRWAWCAMRAARASIPTPTAKSIGTARVSTACPCADAVFVAGSDAESNRLLAEARETHDRRGVARARFSEHPVGGASIRSAVGVWHLRRSEHPVGVWHLRRSGVSIRSGSGTFGGASIRSAERASGRGLAPSEESIRSGSGTFGREHPVGVWHLRRRGEPPPP